MDSVAQLGTILTIWAHPDDETFMAGGILAAAARNGQLVHCVTATRGEHGVQDESRWPQATLGATRSSELAAALQELKITSHEWLTYEDGECAGVSAMEPARKLAELIEQHKPDTIITFPPDGVTGHPDHQAVSEWVRVAVGLSAHVPRVFWAVHTKQLYETAFADVHARMNVYFATTAPRFWDDTECEYTYVLPKAVLDQKLAALRAMPSQYEGWFTRLSVDMLENAFGLEALVRAK